MLLLAKPFIQIIIIYNSQGERCDAQCGMDWSSPEFSSLANKRIKDRFGDRISLKYIDLSEAQTRNGLELSQGIRYEDKLLPLLVINSQIRISGQFDINQLLDAVDAEIEIKS